MGSSVLRMALRDSLVFHYTVIIYVYILFYFPHLFLFIHNRAKFTYFNKDCILQYMQPAEEDKNNFVGMNGEVIIVSI